MDRITDLLKEKVENFASEPHVIKTENAALRPENEVLKAENASLKAQLQTQKDKYEQLSADFQCPSALGDRPELPHQPEPVPIAPHLLHLPIRHTATIRP